MPSKDYFLFDLLIKHSLWVFLKLPERGNFNDLTLQTVLWGNRTLFLNICLLYLCHEDFFLVIQLTVSELNSQ